MLAKTPRPRARLRMARPPSGISLGDIATKVGLSRATVSRALNNNPQIPEKTRKRVQRTAEKMGYRPDPETSRLMGYLKRAQVQKFQSTIGIINAYPQPEQLRAIPYFRRLLQGAEERAEALGFILDEVWITEPGLKPSRVNQILRNRAIRGLFLPPEPEALARIDLDWESYASVATTTSLRPANIHRVLPNNFLNVQLLMKEIYRRGYRRPGLTTIQHLEERQYGAPVSQYLGACETMHGMEAIPVFNWVDQTTGEGPRLLKWFKKYRPDVIIGCGDWMHDIFINEGGYQCPQDFAFVDYAEHKPGMAGIDQLPEIVGAAAIDLLSAHITRGEVGLPEHPKLMLIEGKFMPGDTMPFVEA